MIQKLKLQQGCLVMGISETNGANGPRLNQVETIEGFEVHEYRKLTRFEDRTPINPRNWLQLERVDDPTVDDPDGVASNISMRVVDLLCPIGLGQRALIASPPRAGKTTLLKQIGRSISMNHPNVELVALLIDERPEEVTDMKAELGGNVFASCLDHTVENHARLSKLVVDRCKRIAESGKDVLLLVDSLTRMARAFNKLPRLNGPVGAGGLNIRALEIWPAIDIGKSGTRRIELLQDSASLAGINALRRSLLTMEPADAIRELRKNLERFKSNAEFIKFICEKIQA